MSTCSLVVEYEMEKSTCGSIKISGSKEENRISATYFLLDSWNRHLQPKFDIVQINFFRNSQSFTEEVFYYLLCDEAFL